MHWVSWATWVLDHGHIIELLLALLLIGNTVSCRRFSLCTVTQAWTPNRIVSCGKSTFVAVPAALAIPVVPRASSKPVKRTRCELSTDNSSCQLDVTNSTINCARYKIQWVILLLLLLRLTVSYSSMSIIFRSAIQDTLVLAILFYEILICKTGQWFM